MSTDNTAANLQMTYDWAVHEYGPESEQAKEAETAARAFFNMREQGAAPVLSNPRPLL